MLVPSAASRGLCLITNLDGSGGRCAGLQDVRIDQHGGMVTTVTEGCFNELGLLCISIKKSLSFVKNVSLTTSCKQADLRGSIFISLLGYLCTARPICYAAD